MANLLQQVRKEKQEIVRQANAKWRQDREQFNQFNAKLVI